MDKSDENYASQQLLFDDLGRQVIKNSWEGTFVDIYLFKYIVIPTHLITSLLSLIVCIYYIYTPTQVTIVVYLRTDKLDLGNLILCWDMEMVREYNLYLSSSPSFLLSIRYLSIYSPDWSISSITTTRQGNHTADMRSYVCENQLDRRRLLPL